MRDTRHAWKWEKKSKESGFAALAEAQSLLHTYGALVLHEITAHFHHPYRLGSGYRAVAPILATRHILLPVYVYTVKYPSRLPLPRLRTILG